MCLVLVKYRLIMVLLVMMKKQLISLIFFSLLSALGNDLTEHFKKNNGNNVNVHSNNNISPVLISVGLSTWDLGSGSDADRCLYTALIRTRAACYACS